MSGHSHWASIKHKKGAADSRRGKLFSKLTRYIMIAAKQGGGDPDMNLKLQYAIEKAKQANVPKENIERAIKKATGELEGESLFEVIYEGYGPSGVAIMVEVLTDNKNRTAPEIRKIFERFGGSLGESGCVSWLFDKKGLFVIDSNKAQEDDLMLLLLDVGADDLARVADTYQVTCAPSDFEAVKQKLNDNRIDYKVAEISLIPKSFIELNEKDGRKVIELMETLENHDDVQNVYANFNLNEALLTEMQA